MKHLLVIIITAITVLNTWATQTKFFIVTQAKSESPDTRTICQAFPTEFSKVLIRSFPCVEIMDDATLREMIRWERMRQLLGSGSDEELQNIASGIGSDYLIKFTVISIGSRFSMDAFCANTRKAEVIARASAMATSADYVSQIIKLSKDIAKQLEEYEICHYYGPVTIEVKSTTDETETSQTSAPCDEDDATVTTSKKSIQALKWELNKCALRASVGTMEYDLYENYTIVTNYPCYKCKNGDQGPSKITEINEAESKVEGLSNESVSEGKQVEDARIEISFLDNGTYTLLVKATSKQGTKKDSKEKKVEGFCESESEPKETKNNRMDIPIKVILGPYSGTINDKVLHQKETKDLTNGTEKTTYSVDFTLTRKD
jgi:hypothetical protein